MSRQRTIANALYLAFDHCRDGLPPEQLRWLADCETLAQVETRNISETLMALAAIYDSSDVLAKPEDAQLAGVLYGLAGRLDTMDALLVIANEADSILKTRHAQAGSREECTS